MPLEYFENKYGKIYPYREESFDKRMQLMAETLVLFSDEDKSLFLTLVNKCCNELANGTRHYLAKQLLNGYFLDNDERKKQRIEFIWSSALCSETMAELEYLFQIMLDDDEAIVKKLASVILAWCETTAFHKPDALIEKIQTRISSIITGKQEREENRIISPNEISITHVSIDRQIVIIIPPLLSRKEFLQPPIDALLAAKELIQSGFDVEILDMRVNPRPLCAYDIRCDLAVIALCTYDIIQNYPVDVKFENAVLITNKLAERANIRHTLAYGPYFDSNLAAILRICHPDRYIVGCVETQIVSAAKEFAEPNLPSAATELQLIDWNNYYCWTESGKISPWCAVLLNRGCPFKCSFCYHFFEREVSLGNPVELISNLSLLQKKCGVCDVFFLDSTFTWNRSWTIEFCKALIDSHIGIHWQAETRVDCLDSELLFWLIQSGCTKLYLGFESLNEDLLGKCNKNIRVSDIMGIVKLLQSSGISFEAFFIAGLPGETIDNLACLKSAIHNLGISNWQFVTFMPRPNTPFYDIALKQFPFLSEDFRYLSIARGIVSNCIRRSDIERFL